MNWNPKFGFIIFATTFINWISGILINKNSGNITQKKIILSLCIIADILPLIFFKYLGFLENTISSIMSPFHINMHFSHFDILLPIGISFYTFMAIGYMVDVYNNKVKSEKNLFTFALFLSFFPQIAAGPIGRANSMLPQFKSVRKFNTNQAISGLRLMLWGYFMKVVIADRLATYVDSVFNNVAYHSSITLIAASVFYSIQIYCDFAGYSNIAIGCAKVLGFDLMINFRRPYLSTSVADFWRRWHISLTSWLKDYIYIPLGGNKCSKRRNYLNIMVTFIVSGIWHGANWTYIIWGSLNGLFQVFAKIFKTFNVNFQSSSLSKFEKLRRVFDVGFTFVLITFFWIFFRANNLNDAILIIKRIFTAKGTLFTNNIDSIIYGLIFMIVLIISEFLEEKNNDKNVFLENNSRVIRYISYVTITLVILTFGVFDSSQFIYFQF